MICLTHDGALRADRHMLTFEGVTDRDMRDLIGQPDSQAHMGTEHGMPERRESAVGWRRRPARPVRGIELIGLADIVTGSAGQQNVPVDLGLRVMLLEFLGDRLRVAEDATQMVSLRALVQHRRTRVSFGRNIGDPGKIRARKGIRPSFDDLGAQTLVRHHCDLGKVLENLPPGQFGDRAPRAGGVIFDHGLSRPKKGRGRG